MPRETNTAKRARAMAIEERCSSTTAKGNAPWTIPIRSA